MYYSRHGKKITALAWNPDNSSIAFGLLDATYGSGSIHELSLPGEKLMNALKSLISVEQIAPILAARHFDKPSDWIKHPQLLQQTHAIENQDIKALLDLPDYSKMRNDFFSTPTVQSYSLDNSQLPPIEATDTPINTHASYFSTFLKQAHTFCTNHKKAIIGTGIFVGISTPLILYHAKRKELVTQIRLLFSRH